MKLKQWISRISLALVGLAVVVAAVDLATFDREAWERDLTRLEFGLAQDYANLDWLIDHRGFEPQAHSRGAHGALDGAISHWQAYSIMRRYVGGFRDPHLQMQWGEAPQNIRFTGWPDNPPVSGNGGASSAFSPIESSCEEAGYEAEDIAFDLPFAGVEGWTTVAGNNFPAGILGATGVIRIPEFGENKYLAACEAVFEEGRTARELQLAVRQHLDAELRRTIALMRQGGATRLVLDVTGNGGGSEWSVEVARLFAEGFMSREQARLPDPSCDPCGIWQGGRVCSIFSGETDRVEIEGKGVWPGPMTLLVDRRSASATEEFAAWLRDNDRATLIGERTLGAGCGYANGGRAVQMEAAPLFVMMPNCARFTRDGMNEIEGLAPDREVRWEDMGAEELGRLLASLGK